MREIRSLEVDIDKGILKINGQDVDTPTIVRTLNTTKNWISRLLRQIQR